MKKIILSLLVLIFTAGNLDARYTCCIDTYDTVMCTQFENEKKCNKVCPGICQDIDDNMSGELID